MYTVSALYLVSKKKKKKNLSTLSFQGSSKIEAHTRQSAQFQFYLHVCVCGFFFLFIFCTHFNLLLVWFRLAARGKVAAPLFTIIIFNGITPIHWRAYKFFGVSKLKIRQQASTLNVYIEYTFLSIDIYTVVLSWNEKTIA